MAVKKARRSERRGNARADARLSMRVEAPPDERTSSQIVTESQNISASGVYCLSDHYLAPLSKVALTIVLPRLPGRRATEELIKCEGIVVRCEGPRRRSDKHYELACMFSDLDASRRERIDAFVTWRNLQALRAASGAARPARGSGAGATSARGTRTAGRRAAKRATRKSTRRRTVH
jgi:c-di-GMP-binding flagellar brake protein YcgR